MHKVASEIEASISIPLLHIADSAAKRLVADGVKRVGLQGTRFTMEQDFYKQRISERYGIDVLIPELSARERVHQIIYTELCLGRIESNIYASFRSCTHRVQKQLFLAAQRSH